MTDPNYTALLLILDRSGSMQEIRLPMIEGINALLRDQAEAPGLLTVDIVHFDDRMRFTHKFADPRNVTVRLEPRGGTALYDAIGFGLTDLRNRLEALPEHARPSTIEVVIITDGYENASQEFDADLTRVAIEHYGQLGWKFTFLGANQDAILAAGAIGIDAGDAMTFDASASTVRAMSRSASRRLAASRQGRRAQFDSSDRNGAAGA